VRIIKLALISAVIIFLIATAFSLLIPSHIRISRAINIQGQKDSIFALIRDKESWSLWHPAFADSNKKKFDPINVTIQNENDSAIVMQLQQGNKKPVINGWQVYMHANVDSLTLQWYMDFRLKWYPWKKFGSLFYESTYGLMMEQGLENIRKLSQKHDR